MTNDRAPTATLLEAAQNLSSALRNLGDAILEALSPVLEAVNRALERLLKALSAMIGQEPELLLALLSVPDPLPVRVWGWIVGAVRWLDRTFLGSPVCR